LRFISLVDLFSVSLALIVHCSFADSSVHVIVSSNEEVRFRQHLDRDITEEHAIESTDRLAMLR
jgi:hypothetical protein